jgi:hypothetical protein
VYKPVTPFNITIRVLNIFVHQTSQCKFSESLEGQKSKKIRARKGEKKEKAKRKREIEK